MKKQIKCAIYTRKSSEEGLEQDFNALDAQREACEAYIKSQMHEGWVLIEKQYNDGGFSGGNMERPAFKELLEDSTLRLDYPYIQIFGNDSKDTCLRYDQIEQVWVEASTTVKVSK